MQPIDFPSMIAELRVVASLFATLLRLYLAQFYLSYYDASDQCPM